MVIAKDGWPITASYVDEEEAVAIANLQVLLEAASTVVDDAQPGPGGVIVPFQSYDKLIIALRAVEGR